MFSECPLNVQGFFIAGTMRYGVIPGAVNVPLYSLIGGMDLYKQIRRIGFSYLFGVLNGQEVLWAHIFFLYRINYIT
jgi:hypothetical protein